MESGSQVARVSSLSSIGGSGEADRRQLLPPINGKPSNKVLPLNNGQASSTEEQAPAAFLRAAHSDLDQAMKRIVTEAQNTEKQIQKSMELLWQRMMDMLEKQANQMGIEKVALQEELTATKDKLSRALQQEAALVQQSAKTSMEVVTEEKKRKTLEATLADVRAQLLAKEAELGGAQKELKALQDSSKKEVEGLQADVKEKSKVLKEYQDKISKLTEKMKELTKCLSAEKETAEKANKATSDQVIQQTSENRKMALEISKLKSQLSTTSGALAASKEEVKRLDSELANLKRSSEATVSTLQGQHNATIKALEKRIAELEKELAMLRSKYQSETDQLIQELNELKMLTVQQENGDDDLDARIRFLQYQNREEKKKLETKKKLLKY